MRRKTRTKVKKGLMIAGIILGIVLLIIAIIFQIKKNKKPEVSYDDTLVGKNYFKEITINMTTKEVKRDNKTTSLEDEFDVSKEEANRYFSSKDEMQNFLATSVFDVSENNQVFTVKNPYQTKSIIVEASEIKDEKEGEEIVDISNGLYVLNFYSEKLTKVMYEFYKNQDYVKKVFLDEVFIDEPINDISQTMYGETQVDLNGHHSLGVTTMGINNYLNIINDNGNPSDVVISTIGYGINYKNEFFSKRVDKNSYNFVLNNKDISETIEQGTRIAEVLVDSTTSNIRIMPLVTVTKEGYVSLSSILKAIKSATENSDVICYELINTKHEAIDLALENAFKENVPICSVSTSGKENYPANHGMTIATSSVDRNMLLAEYSSQGEYIDFAAPSTDVEEIFNSGSIISRWSGPQYSNAQIAASIALIKTYNKEATILDIYNFLRNYCTELGDEGKDNLYGYGCPNFQNLTIADLDKKEPQFKEIKYENENWEISKQVKITADDNIRMKSWALIKSEEEPKEEEWQNLEAVTHELDVTTDITENSTYYIWIQDIAGNKVKKDITIDKIDNTPPEIAYTIDEGTLSQGYVTINVTAKDDKAGLYDDAFSWDKQVWSKESNSKQVRQNGRYKVYVTDKLGNVGEQEIAINIFPQEGISEVGEGNIITSVKVSADWNGNINNDVQITLNKDLDITAWQITNLSYYITENFVNVEPVSYTTTTEDVPSNENENTSTQNLNTDVSVPSNVVVNNIDGNSTNSTENTEIQNTQSQNEVQPQVTRTPVYAPRPEPIVIKTTLNADIKYTLWIKDSSGTITSQEVTISRVKV